MLDQALSLADDMLVRRCAAAGGEETFTMETRMPWKA